MKQLSTFLIVVLLFGCKPTPKQAEETQTETDEAAQVVEEVSHYPEALQKIFEAHGGLDAWKKQRTLTYVIPKPDNPETHSIDLLSRKDKIETPLYNMGFDGKKPWLQNTEGAYEVNVEFYHNLMFYFYAMPFVLADDGINFSDTPDLVFEGKSYPGLQVTYNAGVGTSPKDEYYLHYDPETRQMAWLGYTVTYRTGEDSDNVKWIRYDDWGSFDGLSLPNTISWYNYEGRDIKDLKNTVPFEKVSLSETAKPDGFYAKPEEAAYYERPKAE